MTSEAPSASSPEPVDTLYAPHEPVVVTSSTIGTWSLTLAGPVLWLVHFMVVYLLAEAACEAHRTGEMSFVGEGTLSWVVAIATVVAALLCVLAAAAARRRHRRGAGPMMIVGALLGVGSAATVVAVGLPGLVLGPC